MSIVTVVIVHRHGTRFPSSASSGNYMFPHCDNFWSKYGMVLAPSGYRETYLLGEELNKYYRDVRGDVTAYSTNTTRTVLSSMSLLDGMLPSVPKSVASGKRRGVNGVEIVVDSVPKYKAPKDYISWKRKNIESSPSLFRLSTDPDVISLLDKIFTMVNCEKISPMMSQMERLCSLTHYITLVRYSESSSSLLLPNKFGLELNRSEIEMVKYLADEVYAHHFTSHDGRERRGVEYCNKLLTSIISSLERGEEGITLYSVHDTTLLSLASALGVRVQCPNFSGYFIFELYDCGDVAIKYNPNPREIRVSELVARTISDEYCHFDSLDEGLTPIEVLRSKL